MRKSLAIGAGATLATVLTHGLVYSGMTLDASKPLPPSTYQGFFEHALLAIWRFWSHAHGWEPTINHSQLSHVEEFGGFFGLATLLVCPLLGFFLFSLASRLRMSWRWWKPLAIAIVFTTPLPQVIRHPFLSAGLNEPLAEAARTVVVFALMVWSVSATHIPAWWRPESSPSQSGLAPALFHGGGRPAQE